MAYTLILRNGLEIVCDTMPELRAAVGEFAGDVGKVERKDTAGRGSGPARSWQLARWYAGKLKMTPDEARSKIAELKRKYPDEYEALIAEFNDANVSD